MDEAKKNIEQDTNTHTVQTTNSIHIEYQM